MPFVPGQKLVPNTNPGVRRLMQKADTGMTLTPMQDRFVAEYLVDLNGTAAAIRAGAEPKTAQRLATKWLTPNGAVAAAVARAMAERSKRVGITQDRVLREFGRIAFSDPRSSLKSDGTLKAPEDLNDDDAAVVAGVKTRRLVEINPDTGKVQQAEIQEVKFHDKLSALDKIARHLGMYNDKLDVNITSLSDRLNEAFARTQGRIIEAEVEIDPEEDEIEQQVEENEDAVRALGFQQPELDDETKEMLGL